MGTSRSTNYFSIHNYFIVFFNLGLLFCINYICVSKEKVESLCVIRNPPSFMYHYGVFIYIFPVELTKILLSVI